MVNICKICNEIPAEKSHWWKNHKIKEKDYYERYLPKNDLFSGEKIEFKNLEQYELTDFNDKRNFKKYLESRNKQEGLEYCKNLLLRRKEIKNLIYAPSEFELKSLCYPSIEFFHKFFGRNSYENLCFQIGLINRYNYNENITLENKVLSFICDTRESKILDLPNKTIQKLDYGDYKIKGNDKIYIERKSLSDYCGTLSKGFDRFCAEIERCGKDGNYLIILIEEKYTNLTSFPYLPHTKRIRATPNFIQHQMREILLKYPLTIQFLAVDGRKEAVRSIDKIYKIQQDIRKIDLMYGYNIGII